MAPSARNTVSIAAICFVLISLLNGCGAEAVSPADACQAHEVWQNEACVQTCESDANCSNSICLAGTCAEASRPSLSAQFPADGAVNQSVGVEVTLEFSEPMDSTAVQRDIELLLGVNTVPVSHFGNESGNAWTLAPDAPLLQGQSYTLRIAETLTSALGVSLATGVEFSFTTVAPLQVESVVPGVGATNVMLRPRISIEFSHAVSKEQLSAVELTDIGGGSAIATVATETQDTHRYVLVPAVSLEPAANYRITIPRTLQGTNGSFLEEDAVYWFTTLDTEDAAFPVVNLDELPVVLGPVHQNETDGTLVFSGIATDEEGLVTPSGVAWVSATITYEEHAWSLGVRENLEDGVFSFSWLPDLEGTPLNGVATLAISAVDRAGNVGELLRAITLDFVSPGTPQPVAELPTVWKFETLHLAWQTELAANVILAFEGGETVELLAQETGLASYALQMPSSGESIAFTVSAVDAVGNFSALSDVIAIARVPYTCLHVDSGFPTPGIETDPAIFSDDGEGEVTIRYRLDANIAQDTVLHEQLATQNFSTTPYLSLRQFPRVLGLLSFNDSLLHPCAELESATLGFYSRSDCANCAISETVAFYGMQSPWTGSEATWESASDAANWMAPGMAGEDRDALSSGTLVYSEISDATVGMVNLTSLVRSWVEFLQNPETGRANHGVTFFQDDPFRADLHSAEASQPEEVPFLQLVWQEQP